MMLGSDALIFNLQNVWASCLLASVKLTGDKTVLSVVCAAASCYPRRACHRSDGIVEK